jgi:hypothetical protein
MEKKKTKNGEIWVDGEILMMKLSGEISAKEIKEIAELSLGMTKKSKRIKYNAIDISGVKKVPLSARDMAAVYTKGPAEKIAFICSNPVSRIIGSFFLRIYKLKFPNKLFSNIEDAKKWFKEG